MSLNFRTDELSRAEASFLAWQFGLDDGDDPFLGTLWRAIDQAWQVDLRSAADRSKHLSRLAAPGAFPEEVAVFQRFKSDDSDAYWLDLIERAGLADRRQTSLTPAVERRRARAAAAHRPRT